ncbi:MAG: rhomboid family intramembrane serine protease [Bacteroidales bacterium]|nr:rhomboid family intramembrane serine protease [Bacteroidales bacterium]
MFRNTPFIVKNLIIINIIVLVATMINENFMYENFSLFSFHSPFFKPYQFITHMFMHGGIWHLFFNMYTLWIFGSILENVWGSKKFLLFYFVTGLGAALLHNLVLEIELSTLQNAVQSGNMAAQTSIMNILRTPTVGASGAIYGVLLGYGMLFPNNIISLIFPPIALKAKWFVIIFGAIELLMGVTGTGSDVAHFAHLGGMIFGFILIMYWKKKGKMYY